MKHDSIPSRGAKTAASAALDALANAGAIGLNPGLGKGISVQKVVPVSGENTCGQYNLL